MPISYKVTVPFGDAVIATRDTVIGVEMCQELFIPHRYVCIYLLSYHKNDGCLAILHSSFQPTRGHEFGWRRDIPKRQWKPSSVEEAALES